MKYNFDNMTASEYLHLVNKEETPDGDKLIIKYARLGDAYFAYAHTSVGKISSPHFVRKDQTDEEVDSLFEQVTKDIEKEYEKLQGSRITAGLLSFNANKPAQL